MKKRVYNIDGKVLVEGAELSELLDHEILVKKNDLGKIELSTTEGVVTEINGQQNVLTFLFRNSSEIVYLERCYDKVAYEKIIPYIKYFTNLLCVYTGTNHKIRIIIGMPDFDPSADFKLLVFPNKKIKLLTQDGLIDAEWSIVIDNNRVCLEIAINEKDVPSNNYAAVMEISGNAYKPVASLYSNLPFHYIFNDTVASSTNFKPNFLAIKDKINYNYGAILSYYPSINTLIILSTLP